MSDIISLFIHKNGDTSRQKGSDKCTNIFNPIVLREKGEGRCVSLQALKNDELRIDYTNEKIHQKYYQVQVDTFYHGAPFHEDAIMILKTVKGLVS